MDEVFEFIGGVIVTVAALTLFGALGLLGFKILTLWCDFLFPVAQ